MSGKQRQRRPREKTSRDKIWEFFADYLEQPAEDILLSNLAIETVRDMRMHFLECAREYMVDAKTETRWAWADDWKRTAQEFRDAAWLLQLEINRDKAWRKRQLCFDFDLGDLL